MTKDTSPEAEAVRGHACLVYYYQGIHADCMGRVDAAQVIGGGRFDAVPLCAAHIAEVVEDPAIVADIVIDCDHGCGRVPHRWRPSPECGPGWVCGECGDETAWPEPSMSRSQFGERYGLDMRAEADRIALGHEPPLGIRGLAQRWEATHGAGPAPDCEMCEGLDPAVLDGVTCWCEGCSELADYEREALLGWVRRFMERNLAAACASAGETAGAGADGLTAWMGDVEVDLAHRLTVALGYDAGLGPNSLALALCEAAGWPEVKP